MKRRSALLALPALLLAACDHAPAPEGSWLLSDHADTLRAASCPEGIEYARAEAIEFGAEAIEPELGTALENSRLSLAGAWVLSSNDRRFGGLSGLDVLPSGNLLAVSDEGQFVWISLDEEGAPSSAHVAPMRDADGAVLESKPLTDAEGLLITEDGLALVSFEREHRLLAYDLEGCGAAARGALVADISSRPYGMRRDMEENGGAEGLAIYGTQLYLGIETNDEGGVLARLDGGPRLNVTERVELEDGLSITGLDGQYAQIYAVARGYEPGLGNTVEVFAFDASATPAFATSTLLRLTPEMTVDNFEAIAVKQREGAPARLWLLSDDNFNAGQRTLLFAFDMD